MSAKHERYNGADATNGSGYVSSIAENIETGATWACGNATGSTSAYNQAACWNLTSGAALNEQMLTDLRSSDGFSENTLVSSMVHRVRVVPMGANGAERTVAVGAALVGTAAGAKWQAWLYVLDAQGSEKRLYKDLSFTGDNETFAYDVAGLEYATSDTTSSYGMIIAGISNTVGSNLPEGGLDDGITPPVSAMRGVERRLMTSGITDDGQVCMIQDDSQALGGQSYEQLLAFSHDATYRLAMAGGELVLLNTVPQEAAVEILNRNTSSRTSTKPMTNRATGSHHQAKATLGSGQSALEAVLRIGSSLSCDAVDGNNGLPGTCATSDPAAFDIAGNIVTIPFSSTSASNTLISERRPNLFNQAANTT